MKTSEKQLLKRRIKKLGLFSLIVFLPVFIIVILMTWANVAQWINIFVTVIVLFILFGLFIHITEKMDAKSMERRSKRKDPFSD